MSPVDVGSTAPSVKYQTITLPVAPPSFVGAGRASAMPIPEKCEVSASVIQGGVKMLSKPDTAGRWATIRPKATTLGRRRSPWRRSLHVKTRATRNACSHPAVLPSASPKADGARRRKVGSHYRRESQRCSHNAECACRRNPGARRAAQTASGRLRTEKARWRQRSVGNGVRMHDCITSNEITTIFAFDGWSSSSEGVAQ